MSTGDQHSETQILYLQAMAALRSLDVVATYTDTISGAKARRPGLDLMMREAHRGRLDVVLVWAFDRLARPVRHILQNVDEFSRLNIEFVNFCEQIDTGGPTRPGGGDDRRRGGRTRAQSDHRAGARRPPARAARRPAHRAHAA